MDTKQILDYYINIGKITLKNTRLRWLLMYVAKQKIMSILTVLR